MGDLAMVLVVLTDPDPKLAFKRLLTRAGFLLVPLSVLLIKYYPELGKDITTGPGFRSMSASVLPRMSWGCFA